MGQTVWYQDFPKKQQKSGGQQPAGPFEETLTQFLVALKVQPTPQSISPLARDNGQCSPLTTTWPHTLDSHHCGAAPHQADEGFLREYDFSKAAADLVVSVPGFHRGKPVRTAALHLYRLLTVFA